MALGKKATKAALIGLGGLALLAINPNFDWTVRDCNPGEVIFEESLSHRGHDYSGSLQALGYSGAVLGIFSLGYLFFRGRLKEDD